MTAILLLLGLTACDTSDVRKAPFVPTEDPRGEDTDPPQPTEPDVEPEPEEDDDPPPEDPVEPPQQGGTLCFPGPEDLDDMCLDVVPYDPAWGSDYDYPSSSDARYASPVRFVDIAAWDSGFEVARNFTLGEFLQASKGSYGLLQPHFVRSMQDLRDAVGAPVYVHSAYRTPAYNAGVGGVQFSRHQWGDAADMHTDVLDIAELGDVCADQGASYVGYYEAHIHCDWRNGPLDPVLFGGAGAPVRAGLPMHAARLLRGAVWTAPAEGWDEGEPLREWTALDADGRALVRATGRTFQPPPGAVTVEVVVGRRVTVREAAR
jgi:hypothetical protein